MNKKGQAEVLQLSLIFEIIVGVIVTSILIYSALNYSNLSKFNQEYATMDLKLLLQTVSAAPGDVKVTYPLSEQYRVTVKDDVTIEQSPSLLNDPLNKESALLIEKKDEKITINRQTIISEQPPQQKPANETQPQPQPKQPQPEQPPQSQLASLEIPPIDLNVNLDAEALQTFYPQIECEHPDRENGCDLKQSAYDRLLLASTIAKEKYQKELHLSSAYRSPTLQRKLFVEGGCNRASICGPATRTCSINALSISSFSHCPHTTGGSVDLCLKSEKCKGIKPHMSDYYGKEDARLLEKIMCEAGWLRLNSEWWHFEYGTDRWKATKKKDRNRCTLV